MPSINKTEHKLFLVCPICQMEAFIKGHFGDVFFMTAPAAIFHFAGNTLGTLHHLIVKEQIRDIYLVADIGCTFTHNVLTNTNRTDLPCEKIIDQLKTQEDTALTLTEKILASQYSTLQSAEILGNEIASGNIVLHTLLSNKQENTITPVNLMKWNFKS